MKLTGLGALACAAALTMACAGDARNDQENDANRPAAGTTGDFSDDDTRPGMTTGTSGQTGTAADTRQFVEKAAIANTAEIRLGELASERAQSADVKAFAQMMVKDHTRANNELEQAVSGQNIEVSNVQLDQKHQQLLSKLRGLQGAEFDREYMKAMVEGHEEVRDMLQSRSDARSTRAAGSTADQEARTHGGTNPTGATGTTGTGAAAMDTKVNQWAMKTLPAVEQHLQRAEQIESKLGNTR